MLRWYVYTNVKSDMICYRDSIEYAFNDKRRFKDDYAFWHTVSATEENIIEKHDDQKIWVLE